MPFYQRIQVGQQQNGSQDIPRHRQWYHSIVRMQEGSMLIHLDANLNDYPGFVKANQWEWEENSTGLPAMVRQLPSRAGRRNKGFRNLG